MYHGQEIIRVERLRHIGIGPDVETLDLVLHCGICGDENYRKMAQLHVFAHFRAEGVAVFSRHDHVAQDAVRGIFFHRLDGTVSIESADDLVIWRQQSLEIQCDFRIIVYHHYGLLLILDYWYRFLAFRQREYLLLLHTALDLGVVCIGCLVGRNY